MQTRTTATPRPTLSQDETSKRLAAEQRARVAVMQQAAVRPDEDALLSVRLLGADVTGPLTFLLLLGGAWYAWSTDLVGRLTGRRGFGRRGKWVYDRSLGGKKVRGWGWVVLVGARGLGEGGAWGERRALRLEAGSG